MLQTLGTRALAEISARSVGAQGSLGPSTWPWRRKVTRGVALQQRLALVQEEEEEEEAAPLLARGRVARARPRRRPQAG